jgi:biotin operon repressor
VSGNVRSEIRFSLIPDWLLGKVSSRAYEVYGVLASHASYETGETFVGLRTIAERLGCSEDTVSRAISELRDSGSILVEERFASSGRRTTNLYTLLAKPAEVPGTD